MWCCLGHIKYSVNCWKKWWQFSINKVKVTFVLTCGAPISKERARLTIGYDLLNGRIKSSIVAVVPNCTFLLITPVTTTSMDLPGGTTALDEQWINDLIMWIKVLWRKRKLAFCYQMKCNIFYGLIDPWEYCSICKGFIEFLRFWTVIFPCLQSC